MDRVPNERKAQAVSCGDAAAMTTTTTISEACLSRVVSVVGLADAVEYISDGNLNLYPPKNKKKRII